MRKSEKGLIFWMERRRDGPDESSGGDGDVDGEVDEEGAGSVRSEECVCPSFRTCKFATDAVLSNVRDDGRRVGA